MRKYPLEESPQEGVIPPRALLAARLLQGAELELLPTLSLLETATLIAIELAHPAYDCVYIATAAANNCPFVTADERLVRKVSQHRQEKYSVVLLADALSIP